VSLGDKPLMTVAEVAERFRVDQRTVRTWISDGRMACVRLPSGRIRIHYTEVQRLFMESLLWDGKD